VKPGRVRGSLGERWPAIPMKPNPNLPAPKQNLDELKVAFEQAVAAEALAKGKVDHAAKAQAEAKNVAETPLQQLTNPQAELNRAVAKVDAFREFH
jgi:hypothetical protein